jgi:methyl-accepting chemotaxis protein
MLQNLKISVKIILAFAFVALISASLVIAFNYFFLSRLTISEVKSHLSSVLELETRHIETYIDQNIEQLKLITSRTDLRQSLVSYRQTANPSELINIRKIIKDAIEESEGVDEVCLINPEGEVIVSTVPGNEGVDFSSNPNFVSAKSENIIFLTDNPQLNQIELHLMGPVFMDGETIGVMMVHRDLAGISEITLDRTGLGRTGESYIISDNGRLVTPLRFGEGVGISPYDQLPPTYSVELCLAHAGQKETVIDSEPAIYEDYRGKKVLGGHAHVRNMGWCLITEIDVEEAVSEKRLPIMTVTLIIAALAIIGMLFTGHFIARSIARPIKKLTRETKKISRGNLEVEIDINSKDEIGELADNFQKMVDKLKDMKENLEAKVKDRTKRLEKNIEDMQSLQKYFVGRELEMKKLKEKISCLEKKGRKKLKKDLKKDKEK